jgi:hypothetical protein
MTMIFIVVFTLEGAPVITITRIHAHGGSCLKSVTAVV